MDDLEEPLTGGNVSANLVRIGETVRRPAGPWSLAVHELLRYLEGVGYSGSPRSLGFDEQGRHVVEYIPGAVVMPFASSSEDANSRLRAVGELIRDYHNAVADFQPPAEAIWNVATPSPTIELISHHDLAPWNLVSGSRGMVFIDWDAAGPGSRLWDLSYAAHGFVPLGPETPDDVAATRLRALVDGYGLDQQSRVQLPPLIAEHTRAMYDLLHRGSCSGEQPWARLWTAGHGRVWLDHSEFVEARLAMFTSALVA